MWQEVGFDSVELVSLMEGDPFRMDWLKHMKLYRPAVPDGAEWFKLVKLEQRDGWAGLNVHLIDEAGNPLANVAVCQGWQDGPHLGDGTEPMGGQPGAYPNQGQAGFTNDDGILGFGWGAGEQFRPWETGGAHWYWVMGQWSEVPCGFGWWFGTNHMTIEPTFQRVTTEEPPPPPDDIIARLERIETGVNTVLSRIEELQAALASGLRAIEDELGEG